MPTQLMKRTLSLLLAATLLFGGTTVAHAETDSARISADYAAEIAQDYPGISDEFYDLLDELDVLTIADLKAYAPEYDLPTQYMQRFIKNAMVIKEGTKFRYLAVDSSIAKNKYDFENLVRDSRGHAKYIEGGSSIGVKGIDVSEFQGEINWKKVKADGVKFAIIRLGYRGWGSGKIVEDSYFKQNIKNATAAGVKVGVYFYSQATTAAEAKEEAEFVLKRIKNYNLSYPVVFDIETAPSASARTAKLTRAQATKITKAFCDRISQAGYKPMIYSYARYFMEKLDLTQLTKYDKWVAAYYEVPYYPYKLNILQYGAQGKVDGIKGNVDMNISFTGYTSDKVNLNS